MSLVRELLDDTSIPWEERQQALDRIYSNPGIPVPNSTASYWFKQPWRVPEAASGPTPEEADVVIIGSGITGTSVADSILRAGGESQIRPRVVMLEAREICSGATGRNGGHCLETGEEYLELKEAFGVEAALKIVKFRFAHLPAFLGIANELRITQDSQVRAVQFISAHFSQDSWCAARQAIEALQQDAPDLGNIFSIVDSPQGIQALGVQNAYGVITGPAGAMWPYKFVTAVLNDLISKYPEQLSLYEHTPAISVTESEDSYLVRTSRGIIRCKNVVHCTNGHCTNILPELRGNIFPLRGQMSAQRNLAGRSNQSHKHSWLLNYERGYDYLTQLPTVDGVCDSEMMLGGGFASSTSSRLREIGVTNDDTLDQNIKKHLEGALKKVLIYNEDKERLDGQPIVKSMWTGIMGFSGDGMPFVGQVPDPGQSFERSQWVAAAFSGEGMVHAWLSGKAIAEMINGFNQGRLEDALETICQWLPEQFLVSPERLQRTKMPEHVSQDEETHSEHDSRALPDYGTSARL